MPEARSLSAHGWLVFTGEVIDPMLPERDLFSFPHQRAGDQFMLVYSRYNDPTSSMPFGTFSAKAAAAFSFGFLTKKMHEAITSCRKIRNAYAHADNPDDARASKEYGKHRPRLMGLDPEHTRRSIEKFRQLHAGCIGVIEVTPECSDVSAVMLAVCENLGSAAFFALATAQLPPRVVPAFFGPGDAIPSMKERQTDKE